MSLVSHKNKEHLLKTKIRQNLTKNYQKVPPNVPVRGGIIPKLQ